MSLISHSLLCTALWDCHSFQVFPSHFQTKFFLCIVRAAHWEPLSGNRVLNVTLPDPRPATSLTWGGHSPHTCIQLSLSLSLSLTLSLSLLLSLLSASGSWGGEPPDAGAGGRERGSSGGRWCLDAGPCGPDGGGRGRGARVLPTHPHPQS